MRVDFRSIADLRRSIRRDNCQSHESLSPLQKIKNFLLCKPKPQTPRIISTLDLIKFYIESTKNENKKQVRLFLKITRSRWSIDAIKSDTKNLNLNKSSNPRQNLKLNQVIMSFDWPLWQTWIILNTTDAIEKMVVKKVHFR